MLFHDKTSDATLRELESSLSGLTATQVSVKQSAHGPNKLKEKPKKTNLG